MKTGLIIIILIVVILLFMAAGWYVMNKIDGFMNRTRRTNDKGTMNAVLKVMITKKRDIKLKMCYYIQNKIRW